MKKTLLTAILTGLFAAATMSAQFVAARNGQGYGPGNGSGYNGNGPKDGTGYGAKSGKGQRNGTCDQTGPKGTSAVAVHRAAWDGADASGHPAGGRPTTSLAPHQEKKKLVFCYWKK